VSLTDVIKTYTQDTSKTNYEAYLLYFLPHFLHTYPALSVITSSGVCISLSFFLPSLPNSKNKIFY